MRKVYQRSTSLKETPQPILCRTIQCHQSSHLLRAGGPDIVWVTAPPASLPLEREHGEHTLHQVQGDRAWVPEGTAPLVLGAPAGPLPGSHFMPASSPSKGRRLLSAVLPPLQLCLRAFLVWWSWLAGTPSPALLRRALHLRGATV